MREQDKPLVLASGSRIRRELLASSGLDFGVVPANIDEAELKRDLLAAVPPAEPRDVARALARAKALEVSGRIPGAFVIGADQVLEFDGAILSKAPDMAAAKRQLQLLSGKAHALHSAVAVAIDQGTVAEIDDTATLFMRAVSGRFLDGYLDAAGERVLASVGSYELEGLGVQLFDRIEGDYFTVLGLPLLPLLSALRREGAIAS